MTAGRVACMGFVTIHEHRTLSTDTRSQTQKSESTESRDIQVQSRITPALVLSVVMCVKRLNCSCSLQRLQPPHHSRLNLDTMRFAQSERRSPRASHRHSSQTEKSLAKVVSCTENRKSNPTRPLKVTPHSHANNQSSSIISIGGTLFFFVCCCSSLSRLADLTPVFSSCFGFHVPSACT